MRYAFLKILILSLTSTVAHADRIETRNGFLDSLEAALTKCKECSKTESLRKAAFVPAHSDVKKIPAARAKMAEAYDIGNKLMALDDKVLRGAHYQNEVSSFMLLACDAIPYDTGSDLAENLAYLNKVIGARSVYQGIIVQMQEDDSEDKCRSKFVINMVDWKTCELADENTKDCSKLRPQKSVSDCRANFAIKRGKL